MNRKSWIALGALPAVALLMAAPQARAESLSFNNEPVSNVIAQMAKQYGINIVLKGDLSPSHRVSLTVGNVDGPGGVLDAVSTLSNALRADFDKVYVVSKYTGTGDLPPATTDTFAQVVFADTTLPARDAIEAVAAADGAATEIYGTLEGTVTLSDRVLRVPEAASQVQKQTHTRWKAFYALTPRGGLSRLHMGKVVDHTASGQPIIEQPVSAYAHRTTTPETAAAAATANGTATADNGTVAANSAAASNAVPYDPSAYPNMYGYPYSYPYGYGGAGMYGYPWSPPAYTFGTGGIQGISGNPVSTGGLTVLPSSPWGAPPVVIGNP
jgi:hypothetical protein